MANYWKKFNFESNTVNDFIVEKEIEKCSIQYSLSKLFWDILQIANYS